jgi:NinB protein
MTRAMITLRNQMDRERAISWIRSAPTDTRVEFMPAKRTLAQNDKMWALLTDISIQVRWAGEKLRPADWRDLFLDALKRELRVMPTLDGNGVMRLGKSTSSLTKAEMSDLIELIYAFGAEHNVVFQEPGGAAPAGGDPLPHPTGGSPAALPDPPQVDNAANLSPPAKRKT